MKKIWHGNVVNNYRLNASDSEIEDRWECSIDRFFLSDGKLFMWKVETENGFDKLRCFVVKCRFDNDQILFECFQIFNFLWKNLSLSFRFIFDKILKRPLKTVRELRERERVRERQINIDLGSIIVDVKQTWKFKSKVKELTTGIDFGSVYKNTQTSIEIIIESRSIFPSLSVLLQFSELFLNLVENIGWARINVGSLYFLNIFVNFHLFWLSCFFYKTNRLLIVHKSVCFLLYLNNFLCLETIHQSKTSNVWRNVTNKQALEFTN